MDTSDIDRKLIRLFAESVERAWRHLPLELSVCESPIEKLFLCALWSQWGWIGRLEIAYYPLSVLRDCAAAEPKIFCSPQVEIGPYRVDFLLASDLPGASSVNLVAVECDGHEFHERTKEQAARDKSRDRELMAQGVRVMRFAGSEIWRDAGTCADQVARLLEREWSDACREVVLARQRHP